jgi:SAM-dependent methyltransferase
MAAMSAYTGYDPEAEKQRLLLQSEVLEPIGDRVLARLGPLDGTRALDVACGAMGLLRALSRRVGASGRVVGTDVNEAMVARAREVCAEGGLDNVEVVRDDLFASRLPERSFDLVHARLVLAPLGRDAEVAAALERLVKPGGVVVLEEPDGFHSFRVWPDSGTHARLFALIERAFEDMGGIDAGPRLLPLARARGWSDVHFDAHLAALPPGHPYLAIPAMMATALRSALLKHTTEADLDRAIADVQAACENPELYGIAFTMMQVWGRPPSPG